MKNPIFLTQRFLRVGPTLGGGVEPGRADGAWPSPRPAHWDIFKITGPSPTRSVRFQSHATSARPCQRASNLTGRLPGLAREVLRIFSLFLRLCVSSSSRSRGSNVLVSPGPAASLGSRSPSTIGIRSRVCHAPIPAFGYRWCGVGYVVP